MDNILESLSSQSPAFLLVLLTTVLALVWFRTSDASQKVPSPPGPGCLPIIGSLHLLLGRLPQRALQHLSKIHGPLMSLRFGSVPIVVVSSPAVAKELLKTHDAAFSSRTRTTASVIIYDRKDLGLAPHGPYWKLMREVCARELFSNKMVESYGPIREEEVRVLMRAILEDSEMGREVPIASRLMSANNNIISRVMFGKTLSELTPDGSHGNPAENLVDIIVEVMELVAAFNVGDFIPFLHWMDIQGYVRRMKLASRNIKAVFQKLIDSRREALKTGLRSPTDFLDVLLTVSKEKHGDISITDVNIMSVLMDMFSGGTDTSSFTVEWTLAELLRNPSIMKKMQKELDSVVGNGRLVLDSDIQQLPFLRAVVKESMRLHPAVTIINRESVEPCHVAGYYLPAKTIALINTWAIGRDENAWERPLEFWPERFLNSSVDVQGHHYELLPFGTGRRGCPGWKIGMKNVELMLANAVHGFELSLPSSKTEIDMSEKRSAVSSMASPLLVMATPRLRKDLYTAVPSI